MQNRPQLYPYQGTLKAGIESAWAESHAAVLAVCPTGGGKTTVFSDIIAEEPGASCAIAHRQELVSQMSATLGRYGIRHRVVGSMSTIKDCVARHMDEFGTSFVDPTAITAVASVDTLVARLNKATPGDEFRRWAQRIALVVMDEAHHVLRENKWGTSLGLFPNARVLGVTATPLRADGNGLGAHADGVFTKLVEGPALGWLIENGFLTKYKVYAPPSTLDLSNVKKGESGDFTLPTLAPAVSESSIVGDVVEHYLRLAPGKRGVTFATSMDDAKTICDNFNAARVPALVVSAKSRDRERRAAVQKLKSGEVLQLVNVDLFGEGFDLPSIEVVSFARPTASYGLYVQQFGRVLRRMEGKEIAIVIDHVGNVARHLLPDNGRPWTLDRREKRSSKAEDDAIPMKTCPMCTLNYERTFKACPDCGHYAPPADRSSPEHVDGNLVELDAATLAQLKGDVAQVDKPLETYRAELIDKHVPQISQMANVKRHHARQEAVKVLREGIAWWAGYQRSMGRSDEESFKRFYWTFGMDVLTAQTLKPGDALQLNAKIYEKIEEMKHVKPTQ